MLYQVFEMLRAQHEPNRCGHVNTNGWGTRRRRRGNRFHDPRGADSSAGDGPDGRRNHPGGGGSSTRTRTMARPAPRTESRPRRPWRPGCPDEAKREAARLARDLFEDVSLSNLIRVATAVHRSAANADGIDPEPITDNESLERLPGLIEGHQTRCN